MNQVNLMNLLYAVPELAVPQLPGGQQSSQAEAGGTAFLLNLKQEIWAAQMPKIGAGLLTIQDQGKAGIAGFSDNLQAEGLAPGIPEEATPLASQTTVDGTGQMLVTEGKPSTPMALIDALTASLRQAIAIVSQGSEPLSAEQNASIGGRNVAIPAPVADSLDTVPSQGNAGLALQASANLEQPSVVSSGETLLQSPELMLADTWQIAAGILKSGLMVQGVVAEVSAPLLKAAQVSTEAAPWALVSSKANDSTSEAPVGEQAQAKLSKALVANMPRAATPAPMATAPEVSQDVAIPPDAPESIRWFAQPAISGKQTNVNVPVQPNIAPPAIVSEIDFAGETKLKVSIQPTQQPVAVVAEAKGEPIVLDVRVALVGEVSAALDAKLTLLPIVQRPVLPQVMVQPISAEAVVPGQQPLVSSEGNPRMAIPEQPWQMNPSARPVVVPQDNSGIARTVMPLGAEPIQVEQMEPKVAKPDRPNAEPIQNGPQQRNVATNQQAQQAALAGTGEAVTKAVPIVVVPKPGKTTGLENAKEDGKVTDGELATEVASKVKAAALAASRAAQFKQATFASPGQQQTPRLDALSQFGNGPMATPASELQLGLTPLAAIGTPGVPAQLLQFSSTAMVFKTPGGLNYLELANRLMDKVSAAKAAGNGVHSAKLTLNPPSLGQMSVNIAVRGETVALQIAVAAGISKQLLKDSMDALQQSLEESGLEVLEFKVEELGTGQEHSSGRNQAQDAHSANADHSDIQFDAADVFRIDPELFGTAVPA